MIVYFNGNFLSKVDVHISPDDRGFLLGDGVYEATPCYDGRFLALNRHLRRMRDGVKDIRIPNAEVEALGPIAHELIRLNRLTSGKAMVYKQITRGSAPRTHAFPNPSVAPTVYAYATRVSAKFDSRAGVAAITVPDTRWSRCDIKSTSLMANCLANQKAQEAGAFEAVFVRDGMTLEGTHTAFFAVMNGVVCTCPKSNYVLPSITRELVLELCNQDGIPTREAPILAERLRNADELFLVGTTTEVLAVVQLDGCLVGSGRPGPVTLRLLELFQALVAGLGQDIGAVAENVPTP